MLNLGWTRAFETWEARAPSFTKLLLMLLSLAIQPTTTSAQRNAGTERQPRNFFLEGLSAGKCTPSSLPQYTPPYFLLNREALQNCVQDISTERTSFLLCCMPNLFSFGRLATYQQGRPCILRVRHRQRKESKMVELSVLLDQLVNVI